MSNGIRQMPRGSRGHMPRTQIMDAMGPVVYAARLADGRIKIGWTEHFGDRLRYLKSYVRQDVELLAFRPGTFDDEQAIHAMLVEHRAHGPHSDKAREYYESTPSSTLCARTSTSPPSSRGGDAMTTMPIALETGRATCSDPDHLPLVDAAFAKPGGPAAQEMKRTLCRTCPVVEACGEWGMTHPEAGIWGGTSPGWRARRGAPRGIAPVIHIRTEGVPAEQWRRKTATPRAKPEGPRKPNAAAALCAQLGIRESDARHWAHDQGLVASNKGRPSLAIVEQYAAAH